MQPLLSSASSIAPDARHWLSNTCHPHILHIFDPACNLINERREILSIVTPEIGNGPFSLVTADNVCFSEYLDLQSPVSISESQLTLGSLTIILQPAKPWNPRPDWVKLHTDRDKILDQLISLPITKYGEFDTPLEDNSRLLNDRPMPITGLLSQVLNPQITNSLLSAIVEADISSAKHIASKLAGSGVGLTPSGDDFIMGALYAAWIIHPFEIASHLAREVANTVTPLTTSLSAAWLKSAGRGAAGILWHQLFEALISGDETRIQFQITKLLSLGHTSGADALAGFIGLFMSWAEHPSNLWEYNQSQ